MAPQGFYPNRMMDAVKIRVCSVVNTDVAEVPTPEVNYLLSGPETTHYLGL